MITVSKESLLYRFLSTYHSKWNIETNLCALVRQFLGTLFMVSIVALLLMFVLSGFLVTTTVMLLADWDVWMAGDFAPMFGAGFLITCIGVGVAGTVLGVEKLQDMARERRYKAEGNEAVASKPWLITEYYRAIKGKYCPQIEYK